MIALGETLAGALEVPFNLPLASDPLTGLTGYAFTLGEVQLRLPGGAWFDVPVIKIREIGYGRFAVRLTAAQVLVAGTISINATIADTQPYRGTETIGILGGDIPEGGTGYLVFYMAQAVDPVYGAPLSGAFSALPGAVVRVAWPDTAYADEVAADVVEFGAGLYGIPVDADHATRGKVYYYASADDAQRYEGYATILTGLLVIPTAEEPDAPDAVPVPIEFGDALYYDHEALALDRLAQQYKSLDDED